MIMLNDIAYVRLGTGDMNAAEAFATKALGLRLVRSNGEGLYFRSDRRAHSLCYFHGDPADQTVAFELSDDDALESAAALLRSLGQIVERGDADQCAARMVGAFLSFRDPSGNLIELVTKPFHSGERFYPTRDVKIEGFTHVGINSTDIGRDVDFWTKIFNARVSDTVGPITLMRIRSVHHTIALAPSEKPGIQHINFTVANDEEVMRSYYHLRSLEVPIVFGPGRHPTSGARFVYFKGPNGTLFEYSFDHAEIYDDAMHNPRAFAFEPTSVCAWGSMNRPQL